MNQIQIGKFMAEERKRKKLTQQQLADILGISNKTISKWECGNGFPEISLLVPLCEALEIDVNELLSGKRLSEIDYKKKAEENMMNLIREREENKKKMVLTFAIGTISTITFITLILVVCLYTDVMGISTKIVLITIAISVFAVGMYLTMEGERKIGYYKCSHCGEKFVPTFIQYTLGMHIFTTRYLKCPCCGKKSMCKKVMAKED